MNILAAGTGNEAWIHWAGQYHVIFVHFPIALIILAGVSELLFSWKKDPNYDFVTRFLLIASAILVIPTVLSGLSLEESGSVPEAMNEIIEWHEIFGLTTLILIFLTLFIRYWNGRSSLYFWSLAVLILSVIITSHLGGLVAFGEMNLFPPLFNQ